jgi:hypothetical protein
LTTPNAHAFDQFATSMGQDRPIYLELSCMSLPDINSYIEDHPSGAAVALQNLARMYALYVRDMETLSHDPL